MYIVIDGYRYDTFNNVDIQLEFGSIASSFSIDVLFQYSDADSRRLMQPLKYLTVEIYVKDQLILTGTILRHRFQLSSTKNITTISGYSKTGVLNDCVSDKYPLEYLDVKLGEFINELVTPFGIDVVYQEEADQFLIDESININQSDKTLADNNEDYLDVAELIDSELPSQSLSEKEKIGGFIARICKQFGFILSHTAKGELLITRANTKQDYKQRFGSQKDAVVITLDIDGQQMFSETEVLRQQYIEEGDSGGPKSKNPYIDAYRPNTITVTDGDASLEASYGRTEVGKQLNSVKLSIQTSDIIWGKDRLLMLPGVMISVKSDELYLPNEVGFFVNKISYKLGVEVPTATLNCVLPDVYTQNVITPIW